MRRWTALAFLLVSTLRADEGMWTFDNFPARRMQEAYGFAPDRAWLDHLRLASLKFPGASGSFVSRDGLVLTNHHVGRSAIQQVSSAEHDYVRDGFAAPSRDEEIRIPGFELLTLVDQRDITGEVNAAVKAGMKEAEARAARENRVAELKQEEARRSGLKVEEVVLYQGGEYWLYSYERHTDVRLVAAPEERVAFFGGDSDNFTFPRHDLDFALFRVYKEGRPYRPAHHLAWSPEGAKDRELVFVTGHPGATARQETAAQMAYAREAWIPFRLRSMELQRRALLKHGERGPEAKRLVNDQVFGLENNLKRFRGFLAGLNQVEAMARVAEAEKALRAAVAADSKLRARAGGSWGAIARAVATQRRLMKEQELVNARNSKMLGLALTLVRLFEEEGRPEGQRLAEFKEANLRATRGTLTNPRPVDPGVDEALLAGGLREAVEELGPGHPFVKAMLGAKSPEEAARRAVSGSRLHEPAFRKQLLDGGREAVASSGDPMLALARILDPFQRRVRKRWEDEVDAVLKEHGGRIAQARFQVYGKTQYPDATLTLRLGYGPVAAYGANGTRIQPFTTFAGLYDRAWSQGPEALNGAWALPPRWQEAWKGLGLNVPLNFAYACDTIGGNSGSPVVNRRGELVGLNFDGNIEKLSNRYFYDAASMRACAVDARAILEALRKVMGAPHLAEELEGR